jgi:hypothetical protein
MMKKYLPYIFLLSIIFGAFFLRFIYLDRIPTGMSDDEILFPLTARSFYFSGKDLTEQWSPFSLQKPPENIIQVFGKVPYMLFSFYYAHVHLSLFTARLPYALFGSLFVVILFFIGKKLFSFNIALCIAFVAAINPWAIFFSRTAYEAPIALYFAFLMYALLLYVRSWKILLIFPCYFLSFYSYIGTPVILPLFTFIIVFYVWNINHRKDTFWYAIFLLMCVATLFVYIIHMPNDIGGGRTSQLLTPSAISVGQSVDYLRRESMQTPFTNIFINKYGQSLKLFISQYLSVFSFSYLFAKGEGQARFTLWEHGGFYIFEVILVCIGIVSLAIQKRKIFYFLGLLFLISPIPSALFIGDSQYALRSSFMFPILIIGIGYGIYSIIKSVRYKLVVIGLMSLIYIVCFSVFVHIYFFQNPIYNYESFGISGRILSKYIALAEKRGVRVQILFHGTNKGLFKQYLFFNNKYTQTNHAEVASLFLQPKIIFENVIFADCENFDTNENLITVIPFKLTCTKEKLSDNLLSITDYSNNQPIYNIYNDQVCNGYTNDPYLHNFTINDFAIEQMSEKEFCTKFFTRQAGYYDQAVKEVIK